MVSTYLGGLLARTGLTLGVRRGSDLLTGLGRLSLRKEDVSEPCSPIVASSLNSRERTREYFYCSHGSSQIITAAQAICRTGAIGGIAFETL